MTASNTCILNEPAENSKWSVSVFDSFDLVDVTREEWDEFVREIGGELFVTYDWCRIWWRHYGQGRILRLYIFRAGDRVVGLAPMFVEHIRVWPVGLRIAKRVGSDSALVLFGLPLAPEYVEVIYRELIKRLTEVEKCDAVWFGFMPGNDLTLGGLREACRSVEDIATVVRDKPAGTHILFDLPDSFETYVAALDSRQRQNYLRRLKHLNKSFAVESHFIKTPSELCETFVEFKSLHEQQWQAEGKLGHFGDWPGSASFNLDLVKELSQLDRVRMFVLTADEKVIAFHYCLLFGDCCYMRLPARIVGREWDRFGIGILGLVLPIKFAIAEGIRRIDSGSGHYAYKLQFGGRELDYRSVLVASRNASLRARLFLRLSDLLHLVYYRILVLRIAPRMTRFTRPLWRTWIRCRI
jgi:CelD/BcsL family acetyltransferase involved in cellulose biosynthesis